MWLRWLTCDSKSKSKTFAPKKKKQKQNYNTREARMGNVLDCCPAADATARSHHNNAHLKHTLLNNQHQQQAGKPVYTSSATAAKPASSTPHPNSHNAPDYRPPPLPPRPSQPSQAQAHAKSAPPVHRQQHQQPAPSTQGGNSDMKLRLQQEAERQKVARQQVQQRMQAKLDAKNGKS